MKSFLVTGGAQGIGKCTAQHLLKRGYQVAIADIDAEAGAETLQEFQKTQEFGDRLLFVEADVSDEASVAHCVETVLQRFKQLDGVVNNAGIANPISVAVEALSLDGWNRIIQTNLTGCFLMTKYTASPLRQTRGAIVNIASTRALQSEANSEAYTASKGGLISLTHALAISLSPKIRVNCISPGWIDVSEWCKSSKRQPAQLREIDHCQHPVGRVGTPHDVAFMVEYLLSDLSGFVTGQNFVIDGGMSCKMMYAE